MTTADGIAVDWSDPEQVRRYKQRWASANADAIRAQRAEYYAANRERILKQGRAYYASHSEAYIRRSREQRVRDRQRVLEWKRRYRKLHPDVARTLHARTRRAAIDTLGGRCAKCGFSGDWRALQIDHVNGGGRKEARAIGTMAIYRRVLSGVRDGYQVLCANCNTIKRWENMEGVGPRQNAS